MNSAIEELVRSLLYEGYALYPYTPGRKNATPTPFGIVYPPAYAEAQPAAFSMLRLEAVLAGGARTRVLSGTVLFLQATGERHEAVERALELGPVTLAELARGAGSARVRLRRSTTAASSAAASRCAPSRSRRTLAGSGSASTTRPRSSRRPEPRSRRGEALRHSLISTHPLLEVEGGRFVSPLEREGPEGEAVAASEPVNTFPVLRRRRGRRGARRGDRAARPPASSRPESLGNLFDNTEIEEALLLHVQALRDDERSRSPARTRRCGR